MIDDLMVPNICVMPTIWDMTIHSRKNTSGRPPLAVISIDFIESNRSKRNAPEMRRLNSGERISRFDDEIRLQ